MMLGVRNVPQQQFQVLYVSFLGADSQQVLKGVRCHAVKTDFYKIVRIFVISSPESIRYTQMCSGSKIFVVTTKPVEGRQGVE